MVVAILLWVLTIFSTLRPTDLIDAVTNHNFPMNQAVMALIMGLAPRRTMYKGGVSRIIEFISRSVVPGSTRAPSLARLVTLGGVTRIRANHPETRLNQHVDDLTAMVTAKTEQEAIEATAQIGADLQTELDSIQAVTSKKTTVITNPEPLGKRIVKALRQRGVHIKNDKQATDLGVGVVASRRRGGKQTDRLSAAAKRAKRVRTLVREDRRAVRMIKPAIIAVQTYGDTAIGMAPSNILKAQATVAEATGY